MFVLLLIVGHHTSHRFSFRFSVFLVFIFLLLPAFAAVYMWCCCCGTVECGSPDDWMVDFVHVLCSVNIFCWCGICFVASAAGADSRSWYIVEMLPFTVFVG